MAFLFTTLPGKLILTIPFLLLALAGVVLWRRRHSVATFVIALGFTAFFLAEVIITFDFAYRAGIHTVFGGSYHDPALQVIVDGGLLGLWAASGCLAWHVLRGR